ncbi:S41 family peptidase [Paraflavitalea sp. CAU 1676]|uniref:S41 family peptidase n=1 Tax=Paraflavitalea sp. CAU 1676 TaxID=3032598 RepID=UPI0023D9EA09|nr:S41 family peptidase [Paraflavitalea sp. CAU 1676]MDF2192143.1 S41 family peptidase [Paraflavitalea sp. CAU 1676]
MRIVQKLFLCLVMMQAVAGSAQNPANASELLANKLIAGEFEISYYNSACYFALAGHASLAFKYLGKAIEEGYANVANTEKDEDLLSLHADPRWNTMLQQMKETQARQQNAAQLFFNKKNFWDSPQFGTPYQSNIPENEKIAGLSKLWSELKYNFVNLDLVQGINIDSLYLTYLPKVRLSTSTKEYYQLLTEMVAMLQDGHTNVYVPGALGDSVYARPLVRTRLIEDKVIVVGVYDDALRSKGLAVGQEVLQVNGIPVKTYAEQQVIPYQSSSTWQDKMVRGYDYALLAGALHEPLRLQIKDASGKVSEQTIARVKPATRSAIVQVPAFEYRLLPGNIAYIALNTFAHDSAAKAFAARYEEISKATAIIFDVRNNGGGNSSVGWDILRFLINQRAIVHTSYTRDYKPTYRAWGRTQQPSLNRNPLAPGKQKTYGGEVIVLTSARTYSAAEDFVAAFKTLKRGLVIGEATGGSSGQPLFITLPGGGSARICSKRDMLGDETEFVGRGIQPDKEVHPTIPDIRKGTDTQLQAAIRQLSNGK